MRRLIGGLVVLAGISLAPEAAMAAPPAPFLGGIEESGCVASTNAGGCTVGAGLAGGGPSVRAMVISPDGRHVYYTAGTSNMVAALQRDPTTGRLTPVPDDPTTIGDDGCVGDGDPSTTSAGSGGCVAARVLLNPTALAISPDGAHVYVGSSTQDAISILQRDATTGALAPIVDPPGTATHEDCLASQATAAGNMCVQLNVGRGLDDPIAIVVSPDGRFLYTAATDAANEAIGVLGRTPGTGQIQAIGPDPSLATVRGCIAAAGGGGCGQGNVMANPSALALTPDGAILYQAGQSGTTSGISAHVRNAQTGALSLPSNNSRCVQDDDVAIPSTGCTTARNIQSPVALATSPDGTSLYVVSVGNGGSAKEAAGLTAIDMPTPGEFAGVDDVSGCVSRTGSLDAAVPTCQQGIGLHTPTSVAVSPDGRHVYVGAQESNAVTVYDRNAATSAIAPVADQPSTAGQDACLSGSPDVAGLDTVGCGAGTLLSSPRALVVSPNGAQVYAGGPTRVTTLQREVPPVCSASSVTVVAGTASAVPLGCADPNGEAVLRSIAVTPVHGTIGAIDQVAGSVAYTGNAAFSGADWLVFTASDGVLSATPATATIAVTPAPPPPPPPLPVFKLTRATTQGVVWRRSKLLAGNVVATGFVTAAATARFSLRRVGARVLTGATPAPTCRVTRTCRLAAGAFTRRIPLTGRARILPGRFELAIGGAKRRFTVPAPAEGVVRTAEFRASRNGGAVTRLRGTRSRVFVVYRMAAVPKRGPVTVTWRVPNGKPLISDKPRATTIISDIRGRTGPLPSGVYRVTLRAAGKIVFVSSIRIG